MLDFSSLKLYLFALSRLGVSCSLGTLERWATYSLIMLRRLVIKNGPTCVSAYFRSKALQDNNHDKSTLTQVRLPIPPYPTLCMLSLKEPSKSSSNPGKQKGIAVNASAGYGSMNGIAMALCNRFGVVTEDCSGGREEFMLLSQVLAKQCSPAVLFSTRPGEFVLVELARPLSIGLISVVCCL